MLSLIYPDMGESVEPTQVIKMVTTKVDSEDVKIKVPVLDNIMFGFKFVKYMFYYKMWSPKVGV